MAAKPRTCIVCGGRADSGEHIFPACAGGLRENNKIYCQKHNSEYSSLANEIAEQLCFFNAQSLIKNTRTKQVRSVELLGNDGLTYEFNGTSLRLKGIQTLTSEGDKIAYVTSDPAMAQQQIRMLQAQGLSVGDLQTRIYHPGTMSKKISFGGPVGLRAIGYIAQTFFAHCFPDFARHKLMKSFIDYTLNGVGADFVWWDFHAPTESENHYRLGHRITVGIDAEARHAYARVSLYSTLEFAMIFYAFNSEDDISSRSCRNDIDPAAEKMPEDLNQQFEAYALSPVLRPNDTTSSLRSGIESGDAQQRHNELLRRVSDFRKTIDQETFLSKLAAAEHESDRRAIIQQFWSEEKQLILRLLEYGLSVLQEQTAGSSLRTRIISALEAAVRRDRHSTSGLTFDAEAAVKTAGMALTKSMLRDLAADRLNGDRIGRYLAEGFGSHIAIRAVLVAKGIMPPEHAFRNFLLSTTALSRL